MDGDAGRRTTPSPPYPYSYGMNQRLDQFVDSRITRPSEIILLTEEKGSTNLVEGGVTPGFGNQFMDDANWDGPNNPLTARHANGDISTNALGANANFADGHAERVNQAMGRNLNYSDPTR
jgi:prepilin-type processing-associated H-X9-DG protein